MTKIIIRQAEQKELKMIMSWAAREGWNPGKYDFISYFSLGANAYLLLCLDDKPVGSISLVQYSKEFAFIGLFIIDPAYRLQGWGKTLWNEALKRLEFCSSIGLYAVPAQVSRYRASDFKDSHSNRRWSKNSPLKTEDTSHLINTAKNPYLMFSKLCEYDRSVFKHSREKLLQSMLSLPQTCAFVSFNESGEVNGYGVVRPCESGFRIGPLYADDIESAQVLCRVLLAKVPGEKIILDSPVTNRFGITFAEYFGLEHVSSADTVAMFKGNQPESKEERCYGLASLEIG